MCVVVVFVLNFFVGDVDGNVYVVYVMVYFCYCMNEYFVFFEFYGYNVLEIIYEDWK